MALILQLDSQGQPNKWITWQDAVVYHAKDLVSWSTGEIDFTFIGGTSRMTGERSSITTASIIAVKGLAASAKRANKSPALNNRELFRRDRNLCAYCGGKFPDSKLTRDHVHPRSRGGKDTWTNVVTACCSCNRRKDDLLLSETNMQLLYVPYIPSRAEFLILQNRNVLADQMEFLLSFVPEHSRIRDKAAV